MNVHQKFLRGLVRAKNSRVGQLLIVALITLAFSQTASAQGVLSARPL